MGAGAIGISTPLLECQNPAMKRVQHYEVEQGRLYAGEYPGGHYPDVDLLRLEELIARGVRTFIDLTTPADRLDPYEDLFAELDPAGSLELRRYSHEITDRGIPSSPEVMRAILDRLRAETEAGRACYVHCWAGIGRTGTVIGCWLKESGLDAALALDEVQRRYFTGMEKSAYHPRSPQTPGQARYVQEWKAGGGAE